MRRLIWILLFAGSLSIPAFSQSRPMSAIETEAAKDVLETIARWGDAVKDRNTKMLDILLRDDLVVTSADGSVHGKSEEIEMLKPSEGISNASVKNEDLVVRVHGSTAIVTGKVKLEYSRGDERKVREFRYTSVFVKADKGWQLAALHTSRAQGTADKTRVLQ